MEDRAGEAGILEEYKKSGSSLLEKSMGIVFPGCVGIFL